MELKELEKISDQTESVMNSAIIKRIRAKEILDQVTQELDAAIAEYCHAKNAYLKAKAASDDEVAESSPKPEGSSS